MGKTKPTADSVRNKLREAAEASGMSQHDIGVAMGLEPDSARKAVSRLLNPNVEYDPRLSTLLAFAQAIKRPLSDIL